MEENRNSAGKVRFNSDCAVYLDMRLIIAILLVAGVVLLTGCMGVQEKTQPGTSGITARVWTTYSDNITGFSIDHPVEWDYALTDVLDQQNNTLSTNVYFKPFTADDIVLSVNVRNGSFITSKSVVDMVSDEIAALNTTAHNGTVLEQSSTTVGAYPAAKFVYRDEENGVPYIASYLFVNTGEHRYVLYSRLPENKTVLYQPLIEETESSLKIKK